MSAVQELSFKCWEKGFKFKILFSVAHTQCYSTAIKMIHARSFTLGWECTLLTFHTFILNVHTTLAYFVYFYWLFHSYKCLLTGVSLTLLAGKQLVFTGGKTFDLNFFIRKTFFWMVKPGAQNHPHCQSICPVPSNETPDWIYFYRYIAIFIIFPQLESRIIRITMKKWNSRHCRSLLHLVIADNFSRQEKSKQF